MKLALAQFNPLVGDVEGNLRKILRHISQAKAKGADLVCFSELALVGYPPRDLLEQSQLIARCEKAHALVAEKSKNIAVLLGTILPNADRRGKPLFNAAIWFEGGNQRAVIRKSLLPTYDVFDETRYFEPGESWEPLEFNGYKVGVTLCEDAWNDQAYWPRLLYPVDPVRELVKKGARLIFNLSASPFSRSKYVTRVNLLRHLVDRYGIHMVYINQVGGNDELIFDGGSFALNAQGQLVAQLPFFREGLQVIDLARAQPVHLPAVSDLDQLEQALVFGLKEYVRKCGFSKVALGLSGGIDSSLVALIAVKALGKKRVTGLIMSSRYSSSGSVKDATLLAKNLGIEVIEAPIENIHRTYEKAFEQMFGKGPADLTDENIQARIRGNLLMALSNKKGHLVLTTGNKSELAVGYCTLYGDMSGGLAVISDLPKHLVYALASHMNRGGKYIPADVFSKAPSAELRPDQTDQDSLPPYEVLDAILELLIEESLSEGQIVARGYSRTLVRKIIRMVFRNEYKRRQAAPGLKVTSKAFGMGRRYPIACKF